MNGFDYRLVGTLNRASLTMSALSNPFFTDFSICLHRRPRLVRNLSVGFSPTQTSLRSNFDHDYSFRLPLQGAGCPLTDAAWLLAHDVRSRAVPGANCRFLVLN
jgi:hypothetical protein